MVLVLAKAGMRPWQKGEEAAMLFFKRWDPMPRPPRYSHTTPERGKLHATSFSITDLIFMRRKCFLTLSMHSTTQLRKWMDGPPSEDTRLTLLGCTGARWSSRTLCLCNTSCFVALGHLTVQLGKQVHECRRLSPLLVERKDVCHHVTCLAGKQDFAYSHSHGVPGPLKDVVGGRDEHKVVWPHGHVKHLLRRVHTACLELLLGSRISGPTPKRRHDHEPFSAYVSLSSWTALSTYLSFCGGVQHTRWLI